jgi:hypothetical protein
MRFFRSIRIGLVASACVFAVSWCSPVFAVQGGESSVSAGTLRSSSFSDCAPSEAFVERNRDRIFALFAEIDLKKPGLEGCAAALKTGNLRLASEKLLYYYASKNPDIPLKPLDANADCDTIIRAADALDGIFTEQNLRARQPLRNDGGLDWGADGPTGDKEWAWFVNRHLFLRDMAEAYLATKHEVYEEAISGYIVDWVLFNPYPDHLTFSPQWRALEAARRITDSWTAIFYDRRMAISPEARLLILCSLPDHARDLSEHGSFWGGNHRLTELSALAMIAVAWPEFRDSKEWLDQAMKETRDGIISQSYADGAYKELSNHYQSIVQQSFERTLELIRSAGMEDRALEDRAELMWNYFASVMRPDGNGPLNNEGDLEYNRRGILEICDNFDRPDWLYIATDGEQGKRPSLPPSRYFPWAGQAVMRSGWDPDAQWAFFDIGPAGTAHQHNDRLHFDITLGQHDILMDSGRYTYQPGPWKEFFSGASAHNVILVDGKGPVMPPLSVKKPMSATAIIADDYDFFAACSDYPADSLTGQGGARHTRSIFYRRGRYWLVIDNVQTFGETKLETLWHFHPDVGVTTEGADIVAWASEKTALRIRQVYGKTEAWNFVRGAMNPIQGWCSPDYNTKWATYVGIATAKISSPGTFVWLLFPVEVGETPKVSVTEEGRNLKIVVGSGNCDEIGFDPSGLEKPLITIGTKKP